MTKPDTDLTAAVQALEAAWLALVWRLTAYDATVLRHVAADLHAFRLGIELLERCNPPSAQYLARLADRLQEDMPEDLKSETTSQAKLDDDRSRSAQIN